VFEMSSLRGIAAMVSRAAAPAAAAATAVACDLLGSPRSSVGELRQPGARRVSGSIAPGGQDSPTGSCARQQQQQRWMWHRGRDQVCQGVRNRFNSSSSWQCGQPCR
jgi:hypothetical protein